jgi:PLP dependent protein
VSTEGAVPGVSPDDFLHNLSVIHDRISRAGGNPETIDVVAVSKGQPASSVHAALLAGHRVFGENYADELASKAVAVADAEGKPAWHYQGRLQTNKINRLKAHVQLWQTVDSVERAAALASRVANASVLVQIDSTHGNGQRAGALIGDVPEIVTQARHAGLDVLGLMTIAPIDLTGAVGAERAFRALADLADALSLPVRSMGMSDDLESAIKAGSTMIRVGAALFGPRR